jgi:hypothetical protein
MRTGCTLRRKQAAANATPLLPAHRPKQDEKPADGKVSYGSNQANYLTRRIARDAPEILERMKAGEFNSFTAGRSANVIRQGGRPSRGL